MATMTTIMLPPRSSFLPSVPTATAFVVVRKNANRSGRHPSFSTTATTTTSGSLLHSIPFYSIGGGGGSSSCWWSSLSTASSSSSLVLLYAAAKASHNDNDNNDDDHRTYNREDELEVELLESEIAAAQDAHDCNDAGMEAAAEERAVMMAYEMIQNLQNSKGKKP